ncbi:MAG: hypothetical protein DWQ02_11575 [Bacteroidetes bacterium]|nr:MAG: hypothetical protein DWQ02_11575 [Bacteroidota bacterium]
MKKSIPKNYYIGFAAAGVLILFIYLVYTFNFHSDKLHQRELNFYKISISGELEKCYMGKNGVVMKINGDDAKHYFHGRRISDGKAYTFCDDADTGDKLFKNENSDTLTLIKQNGQRFFYKFFISE